MFWGTFLISNWSLLGGDLVFKERENFSIGMRGVVCEVHVSNDIELVVSRKEDFVSGVRAESRVSLPRSMMTLLHLLLFLHPKSTSYSKQALPCLGTIARFAFCCCGPCCIKFGSLVF